MHLIIIGNFLQFLFMRVEMQLLIQKNFISLKGFLPRTIAGSTSTGYHLITAWILPQCIHRLINKIKNFIAAGSSASIMYTAGRIHILYISIRQAVLMMVRSRFRLKRFLFFQYYPLLPGIFIFNSTHAFRLFYSIFLYKNLMTIFFCSVEIILSSYLFSPSITTSREVFGGISPR